MLGKKRALTDVGKMPKCDLLSDLADQKPRPYCECEDGDRTADECPPSAEHPLTLAGLQLRVEG